MGSLPAHPTHRTGRRAFQLALLAGLAVAGTGTVQSASQPVVLLEHGARTGEYILGFAGGMDEAQARGIARNAGADPVRWIDGIHALVVRPSASLGTGEGNVLSDDTVGILAENPDLAYLEADAVASIQTAPDDPLYATNQWAPQIIGAEGAWDVTTGSASVVVALVDTGVDLTHPDLVGKLAAGTDIYNLDDDPSDVNGHGTMLAGVVGAATNNGVGIASIGRDTTILPVKVTNSSGSTSYARIAEGVVWAVDHGARIVNVSVGGYSDLLSLRNAVEYAATKGVLVVSAAGNQNSTEPFYPAAYPSVVGVAATTSSDARWSSSGYGSWVSLAAPGSSIYTTFWSGSGSLYVTGGGTSLAAPHVSAVAALMLATNDTLSGADLRAALESTALDLGDPGFDQYFGHGRLDAAAALNATAAAMFVPPLPAEILFVTNSTALGLGDQVAKDRLEAAGYIVTVMTDRVATAEDAVGRNLVIVSDTASTRRLGSAFVTTPVPVLTWNSSLFPELAMTSSKRGEYGEERRSTAVISIVQSSHPLAAGFSGEITVTDPRQTIAWGRPAASADVVATTSSGGDRAMVFAYDAGAALVDGQPAAARRVGFFTANDSLAHLTSDGLAMFDAAVAWSLGTW